MKTTLALSALAAAASAQEGRIYYLSYIVVSDTSVDEDFNADQLVNADRVPHINTFLKDGGDFSDVGTVVSAAFGSDTAACQPIGYTCDGDSPDIECEADDDQGSFQWECNENMLTRVVYADDASCGGDAQVQNPFTGGFVDYADCVFTASEDDLDDENFCGMSGRYTAFASMPHDTEYADVATARGGDLSDAEFQGYYALGAVGPCWYTADTGAFSRDIAVNVMFGYKGDYTSDREYEGAECNDDTGVTAGSWKASADGCVPVGYAVSGYTGFAGFTAVETDIPEADDMGNIWMEETAAYTMGYKNGSQWCDGFYTDSSCETLSTAGTFYAGEGTPVAHNGKFTTGLRNLNCQNIFHGDWSLNKCVNQGHSANSPASDFFAWKKNSASGASMVAPALALLAPVAAAFL